jgi:hypothetical protein
MVPNGDGCRESRLGDHDLPEWEEAGDMYDFSCLSVRGWTHRGGRRCELNDSHGRKIIVARVALWLQIGSTPTWHLLARRIRTRELRLPVTLSSGSPLVSRSQPVRRPFPMSRSANYWYSSRQSPIEKIRRKLHSGGMRLVSI